MHVVIASLEVYLRDMLIDEYVLKDKRRESASLFTLSTAA
jgi:hypothetical protein